MTDGRFSKTVLLVTHHNHTGTFALCLNRPTKHSSKALSQELKLDKELPFQMHWGGPVQPSSVWMIHDHTWENEHTLYVDKKWRITSNESMFYHMADGDAPRYFRLCYGFSSWAGGQLEMELSGSGPFTKSNSWLIVKKSDPEWIFETAIDELWDKATELSGQEAISNWL
jgi:putative transcriptional regulator